jgi:hypothetical protein
MVAAKIRVSPARQTVHLDYGSCKFYQRHPAKTFPSFENTQHKQHAMQENSTTIAYEEYFIASVTCFDGISFVEFDRFSSTK